MLSFVILGFIYLALNVTTVLTALVFFFICVGELLGIEYLYNQTGKTLTPMLQTPEEEEDRQVERVSDQDLQDEGFEEDIVEDITVPVLYDPHHDAVTSPSSSALPLLTASPDEPASSAQHLSSVPVSQTSDTESSPCNEAEVRHFKEPPFNFSLILFSMSIFLTLFCLSFEFVRQLSLDLMASLAGTKSRIWLPTLLDFVRLLTSQSHK